ncbi:predicted protein [Uncinocarpus reesii 1704]|uniref:Methyltransferase domain-containing protein n=1 Tax=Uncinocarpus reesii (strain UAMH 1704) TaxID=336963 RepID=C4JNG4_UNCRE|nr:uncharacterized protein UREG_02962 [Uncinocarpus reesii 1704]EEP78117.1 predicted protein [Uncinocarpus reesii 1704]
MTMKAVYAARAYGPTTIKHPVSESWRRNGSIVETNIPPKRPADSFGALHMPNMLEVETPPAQVFGGTEGQYRLPHHITEIDRLRRQHEHIKSSCNGKLISFPLPNSPHPIRVLDSGCADGTWLLDLASQHPQQQLSLHGIDIGSHLFMKNPSLDLHQHDLRQPLPEEWKNSFDIVHQRLLVWGIREAEWSFAVRNLRDVLKPGGHILLVECKWVFPEIWATHPEQHRLALTQIWSTESAGMDLYIGEKLDSLLEKEGFEDITTVCHDLAYGATAKIPENRNPSAELWVESFRHLVTHMGG